MRELSELLLVEDNDDDVVLLEEALADARVTNPLRVVPTGEQALAYLRRLPPYASACRPGLVLLDVNMPGMNGFDVLRVIKSDPDLAPIAVIILTTSRRDEDAARAYQDGACSFLDKPVDFQLLQALGERFGFHWATGQRAERSS